MRRRRIKKKRPKIDSFEPKVRAVGRPGETDFDPHARTIQ